MQITRKNWQADVSRGGEGTVNVTPEDADDIWALYNLVVGGDEVEAVTVRKVLQESVAGDVVDSQKIKLVLTVRVEKTEVDLVSASLRVNGRNVRENRHVKLGSYHTLDVQPDRWVKLTKQSWDALSIEVLEQALSSAGKAEIGAIVMEEGVAHVCSVTPGGTKVLQRVQVAQPKKRLGPTSQSEKAMEAFLRQCTEGVLQHIRFEALKAVVIAGTATLKDDFYRRLMAEAQEKQIRAVLDNKAKFVRVAVSSGQPSALTDVLKEPRIAAILADTKDAAGVKMMDAYYKMHGSDPDRTAYGPDHVLAAAEQCAVRHLLLSDALFRSTDVAQRRRYAQIVGTVRENGGDVTVLPAGSPSEADLAKLTGVAAILNFPVE